jgi:hypothetical protein
MVAAALVMIAACVIAAVTFVGTKQNEKNLIPTTSPTIAYLLGTILIVHLVAISQALRIRARLIGLDKYFYETGKGQAVAYFRIFVRCAISAWPLYILLFLPNFVVGLQSGAGGLSSAQLVVLFLQSTLSFVITPASCGLMTAYTLDRPTDTPYERLISGLLQGGAMAAAALVVVQLTVGDASVAYYIFVAVLYGGLGFVLGFLLPAAIKRHWHAQEARLPEKIGVLRTAVLQYFRDIQEFMEWLNTRNNRLDGKRPLDVLTEDTGLQKLTSLVTETRAKVAPAI